jgi:dUTP pyrophosphatase
MPTIPINVKRFDPTLPLPQYHSSLAAGFDFYAREDTTIPSHQTVLVPANLALQIPPDFWLLIAARSSLQKRGLQLINGVGVIDADYCGNDDEISLILHNFTAQNTHIKKGERLAQGILMPLYRAEFTPVDHLDTPNRGGFGTTGN